ncbi:hypothetical protein BDV26DRAFT_283878 [Aspergillus bertholletiae]|uniref:Kinase-like domain-containing protein n=1 Tax=Aspergillus bertholletiae TaxID=1226010 RepID=A0A5N7AYG2_9EURO|nr:hypothetical protein BDV26DRAFT_283878 [Aspergillus bertholletiae]
MEIDLSTIEFVELIKSSESPCIFRTRWRGKDCVLKVYHSMEPSYTDPVDREVDIFKCESQAYTKLKTHGLCDKGFVSDFYGLIKQINPKEWSSYLNEFLRDRLPPNAVLLEYIPDPQMVQVQEHSDSVLLIDFDRAQTFSHDTIADRRRQLLNEEKELMEYVVNALAADYKDGKIQHTWYCYYG